MNQSTQTEEIWTSHNTIVFHIRWADSHSSAQFDGRPRLDVKGSIGPQEELRTIRTTDNHQLGCWKCNRSRMNISDRWNEMSRSRDFVLEGDADAWTQGRWNWSIDFLCEKNEIVRHYFMQRPWGLPEQLFKGSMIRPAASSCFSLYREVGVWVVYVALIKPQLPLRLLGYPAIFRG